MKVLTPCSVPGCTLYAAYGGMCKQHHTRAYKIKRGEYKGQLTDPIRTYKKRQPKPVGPNDLLNKYATPKAKDTGNALGMFLDPLPPAQAAQRQEAADDTRYKAMGMAELLAQLDIARNAIVHITRELRRRLG